MSTVDPMIPLSGTGGFDVTKIANLSDLAQQMKMRQTAMANQNALSRLLADPNSYDASGNVTSNALRGITAADPKTGLAIKDQSLQAQLQRAQEQHYQTEAGKASFDAGARIAGASYDVYQESKAHGASEQEAIDRATKARNEAVQNSGGVIPENYARQITSTPWDPQSAKTFAEMSSEWVQNRRQQESTQIAAKKEDLGERAQSEKEKQDAIRDKEADARFAMLASSLKLREENQDPKKEAFRAYMQEHPNATAEEQARFIQSSGGSMRSPLTMATQKFIEEHAEDHGGMGPTAEELSRFYAGMRATAAETTQVAKREANIASSATALTEKGGLYDQLDEAAQKVNLGNSKTVNWIREGLQNKVYANPEIQRYVTVLEDTRSDLTNVLARTGQATETVRAQAAHMFPETMSLAELRTETRN